MRCPKYITDPIAKKQWRIMVKELKRLDLLQKIDSTILELYCTTYSRFVKLNEILQENSEELKSCKAIIWNLNKTQAQLLAYSIELYGTPKARKKLELQEEKAKKDEFADFLEKKIN